MRDIALHVSQLAESRPLADGPYQSRTPRAEPAGLLAETLPVPLSARSGGQQQQHHYSQRSQASAQRELQQLVALKGSQPKELVLERLIGGGFTAPASPRKGGGSWGGGSAQVTPRSFESTVQRLYSQKVRSQEKTDSLKFLLYQEERQQLQDRPAILAKSRALADKRQGTLPIYSLERTHTERERKARRLQQLRDEEAEARRLQEQREAAELATLQVGRGLKPLSQREWAAKADRLAAQHRAKLEARAAAQRSQHAHLSFTPATCPHSARLLLKRAEDAAPLPVEQRLQLYPRVLRQKQQAVAASLAPSFTPHLTRLSKRLHHHTHTRSLDAGSVAALPVETAPASPGPLHPQQQASFHAAAVIPEEAEDDPDFERPEGAVNPHLRASSGERALLDSEATALATPPAEPGSARAALANHYLATSLLSAEQAMTSGSGSSSAGTAAASPEKTSNPLNSQRKARLSAFLTGSSRPSSQQGSQAGGAGSGGAGENFFTFKDPTS